jgi:hypothetical protein
MIEIEKFKKERLMKNINFSYAALFITGLVVSLAGCSQKRELDPRTEPELVRIVEVSSHCTRSRLQAFLLASLLVKQKSCGSGFFRSPV